MANENSRLKILKEIEAIEARILRARQSTVLSEEKIAEYVESQKESAIEAGKKLKELNLERMRGLSSAEASLSSMSSLYSNITNLERQSLVNLANLGDIRNRFSDEQEESLLRIAEINREIAQLSREDVVQQARLQSEYGELISQFNSIDDVHDEIVDNLREQNQLAQRLSSLSKSQKEMVESQLEVFEGMKKTVGGILDTMSMLTSGVRGGLGTGLILAGAAGKKLLDTSYQLGGSLLNASNISTTLFGTVFDDAAGATKALSEEFGGLNDVSLTTQFRTNVLAKNLGIGVSEAAKLTGAIARLNDGSAETAQNLIQATQNLAEQNGLVPADLMADVAASGEEFALFGKQGGKNILEAAVAAGKLGVNMKTISGIAESLLDFESSLTNELELSAMLGRNINLNRARALAYEGNIGEAVRETLSQLGGIEDFNRMDYFQKKQTAALLGVSVEEFQKMAENADKLNEKGEIQLTQYEKIWQTTKSVGSQLLSMGQGLGGLVIATGQFAGGMGSIGDKIKEWFPNLLKTKDNLSETKDEISSIGENIQESVKENVQGKIQEKIEGGIESLTGNIVGGGDIPDDTPDPTSITDKIGKIKMNDVLKGAAALVIVAGAVFVFGKAVQEFMKVSWEAVGMAVVSMLALVGAVALLGYIMSSPIGAVGIVAGAKALFLIGAAVAVLGFGINQLASGFKTFGEIAPILGSLITMAGGIFYLSGAFTALAASLALLGIAGIAALPTLMGLAVAGAGLGLLFGVFGDDSTQSESVSDSGPSLNYQKQMVDKLDVLIAEVSKNRDIYLDGDKVSSVVFKRANRITKNSGVDLNTD